MRLFFKAGAGIVLALLLTGCASDQYVRQGEAAHAKLHEERDLAIEERMTELTELAAAKASVEATEGVRTAYTGVLRAHKADVEASVGAIVDAKIDILTEKLSGAKATIDEFVAETNAEKEALKKTVNDFIVVSDKKLGEFDDRIKSNANGVGANARLFNGDDERDDQTRDAAIAQLAATTTISQGNREDLLAVKRHLNRVEDENDALSKQLNETNLSAGKAEDRADQAQYQAIASFLTAVLVGVAGWWMDRRNKKKAKED